MRKKLLIPILFAVVANLSPKAFAGANCVQAPTKNIAAGDCLCGVDGPIQVTIVSPAEAPLNFARKFWKDTGAVLVQCSTRYALILVGVWGSGDRQALVYPGFGG
jgi:hypothetical protein